LPHKVEAVEREPVSVNVEVKDPDAPVTFYIAGKKVTPSDDRCEVKNLGNGLWNLTVNHCKMSDLGTLEARTPSNRGDEVYFTRQIILLQSKTTFKFENIGCVILYL